MLGAAGDVVPGSEADESEVDGVDGHIYVGCDAVDVLTKVLDAS